MDEAAGIPTVWHYWVEPGFFAAGAYPVSSESLAAVQMRALLAEGFDTFINLTPEYENGLPSYQELAANLGAAQGITVSHYRYAIADMNVPDVESLASLLDTIGALLAGGHIIYVHCRAGLGRTGTVVGCWLVRSGLSGRDALRRLQVLSRRTGSPETLEQRSFVRGWREKDKILSSGKETM